MRNLNNRQQGGTVIGIIIGLVVGLGIALAVALAITKTPVPFTNKVTRQEKPAEPPANQVADPNKALYGNKAAAKKAAEAFAREQAAADPAIADPAIAQGDERKPEIKPAPAELPHVAKPKPETRMAEVKTADVKSSDAKERDPIKDIITAKAASSEEKWNYYLQAGAFREQSDAEKTRAKLALMGIEGRVSERQSENGILYRVRVGPFAQMESMNRVRGKLSDNGVDVAVVRMAK